ncbi:MAG: DUF6484 domain-containing protein [Isosphaeraceae bacterium]
MDLVSREIAPASVDAEENLAEFPIGELLPSPLAEVGTLTASGRLDDSTPLKRGGPRLRRPAIVRRRKPQRRRRLLAPGEVVVGTLAGINDDGQPLVRHSLDPSGRISLARTTVTINSEQIDREIVLAFESGNLGKPIVLGVLRRPDGQERSEPRVAPQTVTQPIVQATLDGEQLVLTAQQEIVLRCGKASLTLTRAGKILVRGTYLLSRSSGVNRIKGGSVQIN